MKRRFSTLSFLFFLATISCNFLQANELEPMRVELKTEKALIPLYLTQFQIAESQFSDDYIESLSQILRFDFSYNGKNSLMGFDTDKEKMARNPSQRYDAKLWSQLGVGHLLYPSIESDELLFVLFIPSTNEVKEMQRIPLTGSLAKDRKIIHRCSDKIHMMLFQENGIASKKIIFSHQKQKDYGSSKKTVSEICEIDLDGNNAHQITRENSYCITPVTLPFCDYLPNDQFFYVSYRQGQSKIYIAPLKGGEGKRFIDIRGNQMLPAISKNRDKIAFICDAAGRADLFMQQIDIKEGVVEKPVQLFSFPRATQASPTFSPDGKKIAFVSDKDGIPRIYLMPAESTAKRKDAVLLTKKNRQSTCPNWSPDGTKLAFSAKTDGVRQLWIYDFLDGEEKQLTFGPGNKENPVWAENSLHLLFNTNDPSSSELFLININQKQAIQISQGEGRKHFPAWK